jgi:hypothetical protein
MAEVKVKITAQNEVQTGLQASLTQVKQFAGEAQRTMQQAFQGPRMPVVPEQKQGTPINIDIGDYGLEPLRELQEQLRRVREGSKQAFDSEPPQQFSRGIGGVIGRFALIVGGAATVGKIIASAFDQASEAIKRSIGIQEQFNRTLAQVGQAGTFDGAVSGFQQLNALADQTGKTIEETFGRNIGEAIANLFQGRPGQLLANVGNALTGGAVRGNLEDTQEQQRRIARDTLSGNLAVQQQEREELLGAGGNSDAIAKIKREQEKRREIEALRSSFTDLSQPEQSAEFEKLSKGLKEKQATDDLIDAQKRLATAKDEAAAAGRERSQVGMSGAQRLDQEKSAMQELQAEQKKFAQAASFAAADPTGGLTESAARYYELQAQIEQSQNRQLSLEESIAKEVERKAKSNVPLAVEVAGLESVAELEAALSNIEPKQVTVALEATGLQSAEELKAALEIKDKTVIANLQAAGFENIQQLQLQLNQLESKQVDVILNALGVESIQQAQEAINSLDESARAKINEARAKEVAATKDRVKNFNQNTDILEARASGNKQREEDILQQQDFEKGLAATDSLEEASRFAAVSAQLRAQQNKEMSGSFGASSLQRIGFASNEFFDTRRKEDPSKETKRAADFAKEILAILKKGEPLVLPASS